MFNKIRSKLHRMTLAELKVAYEEQRNKVDEMRKHEMEPDFNRTEFLDAQILMYTIDEKIHKREVGTEIMDDCKKAGAFGATCIAIFSAAAAIGNAIKR